MGARVSQDIIVIFHYAHIPRKVVLISYCPEGVRSNVRLGGDLHFLVLLIQEN